MLQRNSFFFCRDACPCRVCVDRFRRQGLHMTSLSMAPRPAPSGEHAENGRKMPKSCRRVCLDVTVGYSVALAVTLTQAMWCCVDPLMMTFVEERPCLLRSIGQTMVLLLIVVRRSFSVTRSQSACDQKVVKKTTTRNKDCSFFFIWMRP